MLESILEGILHNHDDIRNVAKAHNRTTSLLLISLTCGGYLLYKHNKKIKQQDREINKLKKYVVIDETDKKKGE